MSTGSQPTIGTVLRRQKDCTRTLIPCPQSILDYSMFMRGVDRGTKCVATRWSAGSSIDTLTSFSIYQSLMPSSCKSTTAETHLTKPSWTFICSWKRAHTWLLQLMKTRSWSAHFPFATFQSPFQWMTPPKKPNTSEGDVHVAWTRRKSVSTPGTVQSAMFGCVTPERSHQTASWLCIPAAYKYPARYSYPRIVTCVTFIQSQLLFIVQCLFSKAQRA